jgi:hypothetical protein
MTDDERAIIDMINLGYIKVDSQGLFWRVDHANNLGRVYEKHAPRLLGFDSHGYVRIGLRDPNGISRKALAHRLVFILKYGDIPDGLQINHKDGIKHNNKLSNLELMTPSQQMIHAVNVLGRKVGNRTSGEDRKGRHCKLNSKEAKLIMNSTEDVKSLAEKYGVTKVRIYQIRNGDYIL